MVVTCEYCGKQSDTCVCRRLRTMLTDRLRDHYSADALMNWVKEVAEHAASKHAFVPRKKK